MSNVSRPVLFHVKLFGRRLRNRLAVAPMTRVSASSDGLATDRMRGYYRDFARGGFAIVITEGTYTDMDASQGYDRQPGIANRRQANSWAPIATAIADHGSLAIMQLMHAGALSQRQEPGRIIAPSAVPPLGEMMPEYGGSGPYGMPSTMTATDLAQVRKGFVAAARRARRAGFQGVEIHAQQTPLDWKNTSSRHDKRDDALR